MTHYFFKKEKGPLMVIRRGFTKPSKTAGFTLVELMVSLTIFSIVMLVSIGTLLTIIDVNAKAQALYTATTNLSFTLDNMTRELRTGYHYHCKETAPSGQSFPGDNSTQDCDDNEDRGEFIAFTRERDGFRVGYKIAEIPGTEVQGLFQKIDNPSGNDGDLDWTPLTSPDVSIDAFELTVKNTDTYYGDSDTDQPSIDLFIRGHVNNGLETDTDFSIQTHIIQRRLDLL